jgi:diguanylate cyclase (GGDEF)-like protein
LLENQFAATSIFRLVSCGQLVSASLHKEPDIVNAPRTEKVEKLLKHMVAMTCHRDQTLLDVSIIAALQELACAKQMRSWEIYRDNDDLLMRQRVVLDGSDIVTFDENETAALPGEPVTQYEALLSCITEHKLQIEEILADGSHRLWLPIWLNEGVSTVLEICNPQPYQESTLRMIEGMLSVYRNFQSLLDYSERDSLTGLLNRKTFDERFAKLLASSPDDAKDEISTERRHPTEVQEHWLAVVDIDHFKRVNDQFGHLYGDEVLILVANLMRESFRTQDRVFRFGGEEFVVLLRSTTLGDALKIFERFRASMSEHVFPQIGQVTVSIGFASVSNLTPVVILGHADQALYYAKANGRNRVCHYDQLVQSGQLLSEKSHESVEFFFDQP